MSTPSFASYSIVFCVFGFVFIWMIMIASAIRIVPEYKRLSVFRLGRYIGNKGPGLVFLLPIIDKAVSVDTRDQVNKLKEQQILWGAIGETLTPVYTDGSIDILGQTWDALSKTPIPLGTKVRVARVILEVEPV